MMSLAQKAKKKRRVVFGGDEEEEAKRSRMEVQRSRAAELGIGGTTAAVLASPPPLCPHHSLCRSPRALQRPASAAASVRRTTPASLVGSTQPRKATDYSSLMAAASEPPSLPPALFLAAVRPASMLS